MRGQFLGPLCAVRRIRKKSKTPVRVVPGSVARLKMLHGISELAKTVAITYGPSGRTVSLDRAGGRLSTRDGATVAWEIAPSNALLRVGTRLAQEACSRVNKSCGDGTSSTAILTHAIFAEALKWVVAGEHPALLAKDLLQRSHEVLQILDFLRRDVDEETLVDLANHASKGDSEVATAIVEAMQRVGSEGMIVVEEGKGRGIDTVYKRGLEFQGAWESSEFANNDGTPRHFDVALVAIVDGTLTKMEQIVPILEEATQFPHPVVVISKGCFGDALKLLVSNDRKLDKSDGTKLEAVAVRAPGREDLARDQLEDLAALTGAHIFDPSFENWTSEMFGSVQTVTLQNSSTTLVAFSDRFEGIENRVAQLRKIETTLTHSYDVEQLRTRIAKLSDGFCVMRVGAPSTLEILERKGRMEDALHAVRSAIEGGVVPGGGIAYLCMSQALEGPFMCAADQVLFAALKKPLETLAKNAGAEPQVVVDQVLKASERFEGPGWAVGWDAKSRELRESPMLCDPYQVVHDSFEVAVSTAATLLTAEIALISPKRRIK